MKVRIMVATVLMGLLVSGCGKEKEEITIETLAIDPESPVISIVRAYANLLEEPVSDPMVQPPVVAAVGQGDQIHVLAKFKDWSKVMHQKTGRVGWLHNSFIIVEQRSTWWSGDTEQARLIASKVYRDKEWTKSQWPIAHVNIEERFNRMKLIMSDEEDFPRGAAKQCVLFWIDYLKKEFPQWSDHQIFLEAKDNSDQYTLVVGDDKKTTFL